MNCTEMREAEARKESSRNLYEEVYSRRCAFDPGWADYGARTLRRLKEEDDARKEDFEEVFA